MHVASIKTKLVHGWRVCIEVTTLAKKAAVSCDTAMLQPVSTEVSHFGECLNVLCTATVTYSASLATRAWQACLREEKRREESHHIKAIYLSI